MRPRYVETQEAVYEFINEYIKATIQFINTTDISVSALYPGGQYLNAQRFIFNQSFLHIVFIPVPLTPQDFSHFSEAFCYLLKNTKHIYLCRI